MENIVLVKAQQEFTDFMAMESGIYKNSIYFRDIQTRKFYEASITKKDGCVYYAWSDFKVKKGKNDGYYTRRAKKYGFTLDEKGKLNIWFGKSIYEMPGIGHVFNHYNLNWLEPKLHPFITKTIAEKLLNGKITNNTDLIKAYFKAMRINASPSLFLTYITSEFDNKSNFLRHASVAKDVNHMMEFLMDCNKTHREGRYDDEKTEKNKFITDMVNEAMILGKKIDYTWSRNRVKEEHKQWTAEIMKHEIDNIPNVQIPNFDAVSSIPTPDGITLLGTQKDVFMEGTAMKHCLYTSYWSSIKHANYIAYHVDYNGEEATVGFSIDRFQDKITLSFSQCYSHFNKSVSSELRKYVMDFYKTLNEHTHLFEKKEDVYVPLLNNIIEPIPF
jgi:hypothetical protein